MTQNAGPEALGRLQADIKTLGAPAAGPMAVKDQPAQRDASPIESAQIQAYLQGVVIGAANAQAHPAVPLVGAGAGAQFASLWGCAATPSGGGGTTRVEAYWWGFHVQLSHSDLVTVLDSADTVNSLVAVIGGSIPSPAQPWILLIAPFITATNAALRGLDRGQGIYISMSWVAPGIFVPTSV